MWVHIDPHKGSFELHIIGLGRLVGIQLTMRQSIQ